MSSSYILVVDDDDDIRQTLREVLEDEGYRVLEAANGQEALTHLRQPAPVCMVLLDLMMPIMDGWAFRQAQLSDPGIATVPVIAITASGRTEGTLPGVQILKKPLHVDTVLEAVAARC